MRTIEEKKARNQRVIARRRERRANDPVYAAKMREYARAVDARRGSDESYRAKRRAYHAKLRKDPVAKARLWESARRYLEKRRVRALASRVIVRCKKNGMECDAEYMRSFRDHRPEKCPCCGCALEYAYSGQLGHPLIHGPSFDRIDTTKGYVRGNVDIICWRCNALKRDAQMSELEAIIVYMRSRLCPASV